MSITMDIAAKTESILSALCDTVRIKETSFQDNLIMRIGAPDAMLRANILFHILENQSYDNTIALLISLQGCRDELLGPNPNANIIKTRLTRIMNLLKKANNGFLPFSNWNDIMDYPAERSGV